MPYIVNLSIEMEKFSAWKWVNEEIFAAISISLSMKEIQFACSRRPGTLKTCPSDRHTLCTPQLL